jgi:hypothetical protein
VFWDSGPPARYGTFPLALRPALRMLQCMPRTTISLRMDDSYIAWLDWYAKSRSTPEQRVTRTQVIEASVREFRKIAQGGVPDIRKEGAA